MTETALDSTDRLLLMNRGYTIHRQIGEGSYSKVYSVTYRGRDEVGAPKSLRLNLACKLVRSDRMPKDFASKFLTRELNILSKISHPHIIHVHSILQRGTKFMIFMRNAEYGNLCEFLISHGAVREKVARIWIRQLALALIYLHTLDIAHRDIKCENILITENHNVKLADFGFSRFAVDMKGKPVFCSTYCGSFPYAAPELLKGVPYNPKLSDIWSLGVVLFIMLNRIMPFKQMNLTEMYEAQMNRNYRFKQNVFMTTTPEAITIVSLMMEPNYHDRIPLEDIIRSKWMSQDPKLRELTEAEKQAMIRAQEAKEDIRPYRVRHFSPHSNAMKTVSKEKGPTASEKTLPVITVNRVDEVHETDEQSEATSEAT